MVCGIIPFKTTLSMRNKLFTNLCLLLITLPFSLAAQEEKPEPTRSFYLGVNPLDLAQGNLRLEPSVNLLNLRIGFPVNIYCLPELSSRITNRYSRLKNIGSNLKVNEQGDFLTGIGVNVRPVFLLKKDYGPIQDTRYTFISFSFGYHFIHTQTRGLGYVIQYTPDGKAYYDFGKSKVAHNVQLIPLRFQVGKEQALGKSLRISYWVGIGYNFFFNKKEFIEGYSKAGSISSIFYSKSPFPVIGLQIGKNWF